MGPSCGSPGGSFNLSEVQFPIASLSGSAGNQASSGPLSELGARHESGAGEGMRGKQTLTTIPLHLGQENYTEL